MQKNQALECRWDLCLPTMLIARFGPEEGIIKLEEDILIVSLEVWAHLGIFTPNHDMWG